MASSIAVLDHGKSATCAPKKKKERFTITLSQSAAKAFNELKEWTDSDTDSEVFRNALRLHKMLIRANKDGKHLLIRDAQTGELERVNLFTDT